MSDSHLAHFSLEASLASLSQARLEEMAWAGLEVNECRRALEKGGYSLVSEILRGGGVFYEYDHYPAEDVFDRDSGGQYYYHAHRGLAGEHGHFHTFLRASGMPAASVPLDPPAGASWPQGEQSLSHLMAISMDGYGNPVGLFTVNRWVTGDAWYPAEQVVAMLDHFQIDHAHPSWPVNRWIGGMFRLFRPQMEALLHARDRALATWAAAHPGDNAYDDHDLEVLSSLPIDVTQQIALVASVLEHR